MYRIGFDIGGSKIECCVLGNSNTALYNERLPTGNVFDGLRTLYNTALLHAPGPHFFNDELLTPILQAEFGPSAGVIGAALL